MKTALKFIVLILALALIWLGLSKFNWVELFRIEKNSRELEESLAKVYLDFFINAEGEIKDEDVCQPVLKLTYEICLANSIDTAGLKIHVLGGQEVNAFALPDRNLVILKGLLKDCKSQEELAGVIAHELAHIEHDHIMKKLIREVGLGTLSTMIGGGGGEVARETAGTLTSSAFDRKMEEEADLAGAEYLLNANIDPSGLADFLYRMDKMAEMPEFFYWVSTHPNSAERAQKILDRVRNEEIGSKKILSESEWNKLKLKAAAR